MTATPLYSQLKLVSLLRRSFTSPDIRKRSKRPTSFSIPPDTHMKLANDSNGPSSDHLHESHIPSMDSDAVLGAVVLPHCLAFLSLSSLLLSLATTPSRCCCIWTGDHSTEDLSLLCSICERDCMHRHEKNSTPYVGFGYGTTKTQNLYQ